MNRPTICGNSRVYTPESDCSDCEEFAHEIEQINAWIDSPLGMDEIIALTPLECYIPPCADSRVCYGEVCCMVVGCD